MLIVTLQNDKVPGLLFFLNAGIMFISALLCLMFKDTKDLILEDTLHKHDTTSSSVKQMSAKMEDDVHVTRTNKEMGNVEMSSANDLGHTKF